MSPITKARTIANALQTLPGFIWIATAFVPNNHIGATLVDGCL